MAEYLHFTKTALQALPIPKKGRAYYRDTKEKGLGAYVLETGTIVFYIRKSVGGKDKTHIIGEHPVKSVEEARKEALRIKADIADGKLNDKYNNKRCKAVTFGDIADSYMTRHAKKHKKTWRYDAEIIKRFLGMWENKAAASITRRMVRELHECIGDEKGRYMANRVLALISTIYNKAIDYEYVTENPAARIVKFKEEKRKRFVRQDEIPYLYQATIEDSSENTRDALLLAALTGARRMNLLSMRWQDISFSQKEWRIAMTKNGEAQTVILSPFAVRILRRRYRRRVSAVWVFPGVDPSKHVTDVKKAWERIRCRATLHMWSDDPVMSSFIDTVYAGLRSDSGDILRYNAVIRAAEKKGIVVPSGMTDIRFHDLRRTLGSWMYRVGMSRDFIGEALGHKSSEATKIYTHLEMDPVREPVTNAHRAMFRSLRLKP